MKYSHSALFRTLAYVVPCWGTIYKNAADLPRVDYDFVVVGGGGAGNVIANRLTENPKFSVLVLEAGPSNEGVLNSMVPFFYTFLHNSQYDWNYTTTAQDRLNGRSLAYTRGKILGGCTTMNGMIYTRGSADDYDRYARATQDSGWSWNSLQPYMRKNEKWTAPADHHNTTGQFDPSVHGFHGINSVSLAGYRQSVSDRVIKASNELRNEFTFNLDANSGSQLGLSWQQSTIKGGMRSSSATSYLGPEYIKRPNLHVLLQAQVTRVLQTGSAFGKVAFKAVEFTQSRNGSRTRLTASKEVILSAGVVGTPQILLNSGIGDEEELSPLGIQTRLHLPDVGKNFSEHLHTTLNYFVNSTDTTDDIIRNATFRDELLHVWNRTQTGPLVDAGSTHAAWIRLPNNATIFENHPDPSSGPRSAHFQISVKNGNANPPTVGHFIAFGSELVTPTSRGTITLNTSDPFDAPLIDPHYLSTDYDVFTLRESVKAALRFTTASAWQGYVLGPLSNITSSTADPQLDEWIRETALPSGHAIGTASMSPKGANYGVVDPDLRVKGVSGLRIVDNSVLPFIPAANSQAAMYAMAERAADLIKVAWG